MIQKILLSLKKIIFSSCFNLSLFLILMIGIQNSSTKHKVNLILSETINLPVSFIIGTSFIAGSIVSSFLPLDLNN